MSLYFSMSTITLLIFVLGSINATFSQDYLSGGVSGTAYRDTVTIGGVVARGQIIGAANFTQDIEEESLGLLDGIRLSFDLYIILYVSHLFCLFMFYCSVGLGPSHTNEGAISGFNTTPTFVETLVADGIIDSPLFGIFVNPLGNDGNPEGTGELTFGGFDESRIKGDFFLLT
jgi:Eukaryotic aspartyl protease